MWNVSRLMMGEASRNALIHGLFGLSGLACTASPPGGAGFGDAGAGTGNGSTGVPDHGTNGVTTGMTSGADGTTSDEVDGSGGLKLDVGSLDLGAAGGCKGDLSTLDFSYIWIANSWEGTVSKIDTLTGVELGRYRTGPQEDPDPSRTSVNLAGDVAVVNRGGSVAKIDARSDECPDRDGDGVVRTSTGPEDVLPFGTDDCLAWHVPLPSDPDDHQGGPRPVAWEGGNHQSGDECDAVADPRVWVAWYDSENGSALVRRLDGMSGATLDEVEIVDWGSIGARPYGGAVDGDGNFWMIGHGSAAPAARIDAVDLSITRVDNPPGGTGWYGMALDQDGAPWISGCSSGTVYRIDPDSLEVVPEVSTGGCLRGMAIDRDGMAWIAGNNPCRLVQVDTITGTKIDDAIPLPSCEMVVGVSIDVEGYVWVVDYLGSRALKVDPDTHAVVATNDGLRDPYTYSDMTGAGLDLVVNPPAG